MEVTLRTEHVVKAINFPSEAEEEDDNSGRCHHRCTFISLRVPQPLYRKFVGDFTSRINIVGIGKLRLRKTSQYGCIRIVMAYHWGFHKYSGIAHF
jgi:hypothetical protein